MADCFPPAPVGVINQTLMTVFGNNFFPPFNAGFQPTSRTQMTNERTLQMSFPGGGKAKPVGDPNHKHLSEMLTPITGALSSVFSFFGPLFIILDLIRAIIDILCSFFNPAPMIASIVDLFLTVVPPAIALFPPLSSILLALNTAKLVIAIVVSLTAAIVPIIELIVENALSISTLIAEGNVSAVESVTTKICVLIETFTNELGAFAPISFIIELLELFMSLGSKFFCASDALCCNSEVCPPIIQSPPSGTGTVSSVRQGITLADLVSPINPLEFPIALSDISGGLIPDITIGPLDLVPIADADLEGFVFVEPEMTIAIAGVANLADLQNYIVEPDKIPGAASEEDPATIRITLTNLTTGSTITARAVSATATSVSVRSDAFSEGDEVEYTVVPDQISLLKLNLIGLGCADDIQAAAAGVRAAIDETSQGIQAVSGGGARSGFESLVSKIGRNFPAIPIDDYNACLAAQQAAPAVSQAECIFDVSSAYLDEVKDFVLDLLCLGASRRQSEFLVSSQFIVADSTDFATITLEIKDANGVSLLENFITNATVPSDFNAQFATTLGTIGPVVFDSTAGVFRANISSEVAGTAFITAQFTVKGSVCMIPATFDGFTLTDKVLEVQFQRAGGAFPRRRRQTPYVQSAGGRRR